MKTSRVLTAACAVAITLAAASGCSRESTDSGSGGESAGPTVAQGAADGVLVGADQPRSDSDFWSAYAGYLGPKAAQAGVKLENTSSDNDSNRLKSNVDTLLSKEVKALIIAPQDTAAAAPAIAAAKSANVPVVSVDTQPDSGGAYMVVRADNRAYGTNSCIYLGEKLGGAGKVVEFQGDLSSINGRDRSEAFASCMKSNYPGIKVIEIPTDWEGDRAASGLQDKLLTDPDINGIYMQAGGVFLQPTLALLKRENKLVPAGQNGHITIVSNDGIPAEFAAIEDGSIDATISQPADLYAQYATYYARAAADGKTFSPGPTDHNSMIIDTGINGMLEDQLPAPVVTLEGGGVGSLSTVPVTSSALWGNNSR
ncbi:sugar ABC transporter substrate-binding protein [Gordonia rhizosphera]|uniref:Putative sugar ABC transporter substrate-binding protein n=1 Tax=Gordonia rhizosphera NBRC 16068 TaxID=1108045 RepID=K6X313_9ACTN|nr:sugar ABC transporter substrate-binding protein [Gordonia rhizosphera]GAB93189.1 putative sugar ABC transporter substrate-binding protein [Gordonia rhizosphera NBRC 16068]